VGFWLPRGLITLFSFLFLGFLSPVSQKIKLKKKKKHINLPDEAL